MFVLSSSNFHEEVENSKCSAECPAYIIVSMLINHVHVRQRALINFCVSVARSVEKGEAHNSFASYITCNDFYRPFLNISCEATGF